MSRGIIEYKRMLKENCSYYGLKVAIGYLGQFNCLDVSNILESIGASGSNLENKLDLKEVKK